jgi:hypothetical protein
MNNIDNKQVVLPTKSGCVRTETTEVNKIVIDSLAPFFSVFGYHNHGLQGIQLLTEPSALFCQGNVLLHRGTDPKELAHLIECSAERSDEAIVQQGES